MPSRLGVHAPAFTLAELLIAIGILGVCLSLGATLFPMAIKTHEQSILDTAGLLVCENEMNVARAVLTDGSIGQADMDVQWISTHNAAVTTTLSDFAFCDPAVTMPKPDMSSVPNGNADWEWVSGSSGWMYAPKALKGAVIFARRIAPNLNDFQLIAVEYEKADPSHGVWAKLLSGATVNRPGSVSGTPATVAVQASDKQYLQKGGVIIVASDGINHHAGNYAIIDTISGRTAVMKSTIFPDDASETDDVYVVWEGDAPDSDLCALVDRNPVKAVMSTRTALR
jgi:prepilin-type N-terminal cleavage/methylation domain-containing protein